MVVETAFFVLGTYLIVGDELAVGAFVALVEYFAIARMAVSWLSRLVVRGQTHLAGVRRFARLLSLPREPAPGHLTRLADAGFEFHGVDFAYEPAQPVLNDFSLTVQPEERIAIVGASGVGKSSVALLLLRFYEPTSGGIRVGGEAVQAYDTRSLRRSIAFVPSDPVVFSDSLRANLTFVAGAVAEERLWQALEQTDLAQTVREMPQGWIRRWGGAGSSSRAANGSAWGWCVRCSRRIACW